jgi:arylformamidase
MPGAWIDISAPLTPALHVFPGDPPFHCHPVASIATGAPANLSRFEGSTHMGTHVDAPLHFLPGPPGVEALPLDALCGPAFVADATACTTHLTAADLARLHIPDGCERLLLKTASAALWDLPDFSPDYVALTPEAAHDLVRRGIRLVGIDYLSIAPFANPAPAHVALLEAGIVILEGLDLRPAATGAYELLCLPLLLPGADGAPARALLRPL